MVLGNWTLKSIKSVLATRDKERDDDEDNDEDGSHNEQGGEVEYWMLLAIKKKQYKNMRKSKKRMKRMTRVLTIDH